MVTQTSLGELCRLTVHGPGRSIELAVPAQVPLADLLPTIASYLGEDLADAGLEHDGWVLQWLGGEPFDELVGLAAQGVRDGDVVHMRPRADALPPVDFDDLVDGIATAMAERNDKWRPAMTRWAYLAAMAAALLAGLVPVLAGGWPVIGAGAAGVLSLTLMLGAVAASRALGDAPAAGVLGIAAVLYAGAAGYLAASATPGGGALLAGGVTATAVALLVGVGTAVARPLFVGVAIVTGLSALGGILAALTASTVEAAAIVLGLVMVTAALVPTLSFRLAKLRLEPLPATAQELQENLEPEPGPQLLARARVADDYMAGILGGISVIGVGCLVPLSRASGWAPLTLVAVGSLLALLHSRAPVSARQRIATVVPGVIGVALLAVALAGRTGPVGQALVPLLALALAGALLAGSRSLPERRLVPYWGRIGDLLQSGAALAVVPLILAVLDVYAYARAAAS